MTIAAVAHEAVRLTLMTLLFLIACMVIAVGALVRPILSLADVSRR